jgi:hypothetical protein
MFGFSAPQVNPAHIIPNNSNLVIYHSFSMQPLTSWYFARDCRSRQPADRDAPGTAIDGNVNPPRVTTMQISRLLVSFLPLFLFLPSLAVANDNLADKSELYLHLKKAFVNPADNPDLPRALLIGDSISIGYTVHVRKLLDGKVNVHRIKGNAQHTTTGRNKIKQWIGKGDWNVIHFNWGLWDLCYRHPESKVQGHRDKVRGTLTTSLDDYRANLEAIVAELKKTGATLIWCATTPVPEHEAGRKLGDDHKYNAVAAEVMKKHGIRINDLNAHARTKGPEIHTKKGDVHYTAAGSAYLAEKVAAEILDALKK